MVMTLVMVVNYSTVMVLGTKLQLAAAAWESRTILYNFSLMVQHEGTQDVIQVKIFLFLSSSISHLNLANI